MKIKKQIIKETERKFLVVTTMPKYGESKSYTGQIGFEDWEDAYKYFKKECLYQTEHCMLVDTTRIIGLYRFNVADKVYECVRQIIIQAYDKF